MIYCLKSSIGWVRGLMVKASDFDCLVTKHQGIAGSSPVALVVIFFCTGLILSLISMHTDSSMPFAISHSNISQLT